MGDIEKLSGTPIRVRNLQVALKGIPGTSHLYLGGNAKANNSKLDSLRRFWLFDLIYLIKKLRKFDPEIVVLHTLGGASKYYICLRLLRLRYLLELHGIPSLERDLFKQSKRNRLKNPILKRIEKQTIRYAALVTTCSDSMTAYVSGINPHVRTLLGGAHAVKRAPTDQYPDKATTILYTGNTRPWQGLDFLESASKVLATSLYHFKFILVLSERKNIPNWFVENPFVTIHFNLAEEEMNQVMSDADILVLPRILDKVTEISFPSKIFEYMASGKAIVAADLGDVSTVLQHNRSALLYPPGNLEIFVSEVIRLEDRGFRTALGEAAMLEATKYEWGIVGQQFAAIVIQECVR